MKKKYLVAIAILSICMFAGCGGNQSNNNETRMEREETESEETESENEESDKPKFTTVTKETTTEDTGNQSKFEKVTKEESQEKSQEKFMQGTTMEFEEAVIEKDGVLSWKMDYQTLVNEWEKRHGEQVIGYELIYLDEDSTPELAMYCNDEAYVGIDLYTYVDGELIHLDVYDMQGTLSGEGAFTCEGRQGQVDEYIPKKGILFQTGSMMGTTWVYGYKMEKGKLDCIIVFCQMMDSVDGSMSYELHYKKRDGNIVSREGTGDVYFETCSELPSIEYEHGFSYSSRVSLPEEEEGYGEMMEHLNE